MNLYRISQKVNKDWDTFDAAIVAAENEDVAQRMHPGGNGRYPLEDYPMCWACPADVFPELIGVAVEGTKAGVILASFKAG